MLFSTFPILVPSGSQGPHTTLQPNLRSRSHHPNSNMLYSMKKSLYRRNAMLEFSEQRIANTMEKYCEYQKETGCANILIIFPPPYDTVGTFSRTHHLHHLFHVEKPLFPCIHLSPYYQYMLHLLAAKHT